MVKTVTHCVSQPDRPTGGTNWSEDVNVLVCNVVTLMHDEVSFFPTFIFSRYFNN